MKHVLNTVRIRCWLGMCGALALSAAPATAMYTEEQVAWPGKPVPARSDWPEGALDLVNDPLRTTGWTGYFTELPNGANWYGFHVGGTKDVNRLIARLAAIKNAKAQVVLYLDKEARGAAVVFSIGSQEIMNHWYQRLPEEKPGVRGFGIHRLQTPPEAQPPTLELHVGSGAFDLKRLKVPASVKVQSRIWDEDRADVKNATLLKAIDDFVAEHQTKSAKPTPKQPAQTSK